VQKSSNLLVLPRQKKTLFYSTTSAGTARATPKAFKGQNIPFLCRLLALADAFDALTSDRPYRQAFTVPEALAEIEAQAGRQFDPDLSRQFIHLAGSLDPKKLFHLPSPWLADEWLPQASPGSKAQP